jgi:hypothetical protein
LSEDEFYTPTDMDLLRMENELLAFEVRFLKARPGGSAEAAGSPVSLGRLTHLEEAETDLKLLLRRIRNSPLGPLAKTNRNFRTLEDRYLNRSDDVMAMSPPQRAAYLEGAEKDLVLLLGRLGRGLLGVLFRRRKSFRTLRERYL